MAFPGPVLVTFLFTLMLFLFFLFFRLALVFALLLLYTRVVDCREASFSLLRHLFSVSRCTNGELEILASNVVDCC